MDNSSFHGFDDYLTKAINLPRQAFGGYHEDVPANSETACKVFKPLNIFHSGTAIHILISYKTFAAGNGCKDERWFGFYWSKESFAIHKISEL